MFFNPLNKASIDPNYKVLATAQLTISDQTDASNLAGNMLIVNGSKSQVYLTGSNNPYSPDWKVNNLVLRPYMIATNVYREADITGKYNPDLFDPREYPNLEDPGDVNVNSKYIHDIKWYLRDSANNEELIDVLEDERFSHTWTYENADPDGGGLLLEDKRTLVIKDNILEKDSIASIIVKFAFNDPFADIKIPVVYEIQLTNISTGLGISKAVINSLDGNSFYNAKEEEKLRFEAQYYNEGIAVDLDQKLQESISKLKVEWFIKTNKGWSLLDAKTQDDNDWNRPGSAKLYEIHRVLERGLEGDITETEKTTNQKGGTILIITPGLIAGSDTIKLVVTDDEQGDFKSSALEVIYDYSDPTQCYVHSSNGDKLFKGMEAPGTDLSAIVKYKGELFDNEDDRYNTMFDYYWYRTDSLGEKIEHIYFDEFGEMKFIDTLDPSYTPEDGFPKKSKRTIHIEPKHVDYKATFSIDLLNKTEAIYKQYRNNLLKTLPTQDEISSASVIVQQAGLSKYDYDEILSVAYDLRAQALACEVDVKSIINKK